MAGYYTESNYENAVLQLLNEGLGYTYVYGPDVERDYHAPPSSTLLISKILPITTLPLPTSGLSSKIPKNARMSFSSSMVCPLS